jgi:hypothetical protein
LSHSLDLTTRIRNTWQLVSWFKAYIVRCVRSSLRNVQ